MKLTSYVIINLIAELHGLEMSCFALPFNLTQVCSSWLTAVNELVLGSPYLGVAARFSLGKLHASHPRDSEPVLGQEPRTGIVSPFLARSLELVECIEIGWSGSYYEGISSEYTAEKSNKNFQP